MPKFLPGDIVETLSGEIGIIVEAHTLINGSKIEWNRELPDKLECGHAPTYAIDAIPGFHRPKKYAWWEAGDWSRVLRGPLHAIIAGRS